MKDRLIALLGVVAVACSTNVDEPDAAPQDATIQVDAPQADSSLADATMPDTSVTTDASLPDASPPDASLPDTSMSDASLPDASLPDTSTPDTSMPDPCADCDDGQSCTTDSCVDGVCVHEAVATCPWPAEDGGDATNLSTIPGDTRCVLGFSVVDNDFSRNLSGAVWNPETQTLWLVVNNPGTLFAAVQDGGRWRLAEQGGVDANWELDEIGDAEAVTQVDFDQGHMVYTLAEGGVVNQWDTSDFGDVTRVHHWELAEVRNGNGGGEGLTFVPDSFLAAEGFVDSDGAPYVSVNGMGGLMFVGFQGNGDLFAYDLDPNDDDGVFLVGRYKTGGDETAGLEFDRSTSVMHIWHDSSIDQLELIRLSSTVSGADRVMDTQVTYEGPDLTREMDDNIEGIAVIPVDACVDGRRRLWLATDGGHCFSLMMYEDFPC